MGLIILEGKVNN